MCVTLAWLIGQTHNRTSSLYIIPLFWTRRVTSIYTASWTQCLWEWHDLWWRKRQAQSVCFSLIVIHIPKMCSEGKKLKPRENWQGDVSRDRHASAIYLSTSARWGEPQCRRRSPERWSSHIWTWGWQLRSPGLRCLLAYLSKAGKIKVQKSCAMKQPDGHDYGSRDLQVLDTMMAAEICRCWTWWWQRRSAGLGHDDGSGDLQASAIYQSTSARWGKSECWWKSHEGWSSQMDKRMTSEVCWPLLFIGIPWQDRQDQIAKGGVLSDKVAGAGGVSMLQHQLHWWAYAQYWCAGKPTSNKHPSVICHTNQSYVTFIIKLCRVNLNVSCNVNTDGKPGKWYQG